MSDLLVRLPDDLEPGTKANGEAKEAHPEVLEVSIDPPIEVDKKVFTSFTLHEPTGKIVQLAEKELTSAPSPFTIRTYQFTMIARSGRVPRELVEQLPISKIRECWGFLLPYIKDGPVTGVI